MNSKDSISSAFRLQPRQHRIPQIVAFECSRRGDPKDVNISGIWQPGLEVCGQLVSIIDRDGLLLDPPPASERAAGYCRRFLVYIFGFGQALESHDLTVAAGDMIRVHCACLLPADFIVEIEPKSVAPTGDASRRSRATSRATVGVAA